MALMQPVIVGPLSELSSTVRVRSQLPGATVTVESTGPGSRVVAKGVAATGDERFPLLSGVTLDRHEVLYAVQHVGGDNSGVPSGNQGTPVAPRPASSIEIGPVHILTHLYECGRYVWIDGVIPGADVRVLAGGIVIGVGKADEGIARLTLTAAIPQGSLIAAHQFVPGLTPGPDVVHSADQIPADTGLVLPPPGMQPPIRGCDMSIQVTGVVDGAAVTLERRSGTTETAGFDRDSLRFVLSHPLDEDDELTIWQEVGPRCQRPSARSGPVTVGKLEPVEAPKVQTPLCAGSTIVRVTGLRPGAIVHLTANQQVYTGAAPTDQTWLDCRIPPLTADPVSATQEVCGVMGPPAVPVTVDSHEDNIPAPDVLGPLISCTGSVSVTRAHRGAMLQVFARVPAGEIAISDQVLTLSTNIVIAVAPLLMEGSRVFVRQWACSDTSTDSANHLVLAHSAAGPVDVMSPLFEGDITAGIRGAVPGAVVEVYAITRDGGPLIFLGSGDSNALQPITIVRLKRALQLRDKVVARQLLCGQRSDPQERVSVRPDSSFGPRPFYVVGHNPNTIEKVANNLSAGANGLEPDVQVYVAHRDQLTISHDASLGGTPSLVEYLNTLHGLVLKQASD